MRPSLDILSCGMIRQPQAIVRCMCCWTASRDEDACAASASRLPMVNKAGIRDVKFAQQSVSMDAAALQNGKRFLHLCPVAVKHLRKGSVTTVELSAKTCCLAGRCCVHTWSSGLLRGECSSSNSQKNT